MQFQKILEVLWFYFVFWCETDYKKKNCQKGVGFNRPKWLKLSHEKSLKFQHKIELSRLNVKLQGQKKIYNKINNKHLEKCLIDI